MLQVSPVEAREKRVVAIRGAIGKVEELVEKIEEIKKELLTGGKELDQPPQTPFPEISCMFDALIKGPERIKAVCEVGFNVVEEIRGILF